MDKYAILQVKSKQYFVKEGATIKVAKIDENTEFQILLIKDEKSLSIGNPIVEKGGLVLTNLGNKRIKTEVRRYKGKSRYRRNRSHTDEYTVIKVEKIDLGASKTTISADSSEKVAKKSEKSTKTKAVAKKSEAKVKDLSSLKLTDTVVKKLEKAGIKTIDDLKSKSKEELIAIKGLGEKTAESILKKLK